MIGLLYLIQDCTIKHKDLGVWLLVDELKNERDFLSHLTNVFDDRYCHVGTYVLESSYKGAAETLSGANRKITNLPRLAILALSKGPVSEH